MSESNKRPELSMKEVRATIYKINVLNLRIMDRLFVTDPPKTPSELAAAAFTYTSALCLKYKHSPQRTHTHHD